MHWWTVQSTQALCEIYASFLLECSFFI
ncbi:hypothetical protein XFF6166_10175 [Xanthomonas citri pv. fuscans]|uniref:Uncharacterized protein n=1 Tax=Xanthomonas campestris pv. phaseoli TaxID=317013 RepID=A0A7Z7IVJ0_XANCH|nr:hypothetical protein XFF6166_10175 [Xanthomonas citri pv. fuscans]SOO22327.1 hypothetical protein XFF6991_150088 [Xanthomonas phaseoli pv. phaseoli]SON94447.1 hypothetical protein XFF6990_140384 [Xanthomonas citri pv. fuscans]SOO02217.1 hypothetical protein XFF6960_590032 [Xanthomonas citri pv. fuscans]SOO06767.1 hypothetical protein XFF7767_80177 [Xanthomonas citri pv. fuscans]